MAITALYSAATGLKALSTRIDVIANNLANAETTAFKAQRANFEDLYYQELKQPGTTDSSNVVSPAGIFVGLGTKLSNTQLDLTQGSMQATGGNLDLGIQGNGYFAVKILPSLGKNGVGYTRNGSFTVNSAGQLVVNIGNGYQLIPPVNLPTNATNISVAQDGTVQYVKAGATAKTIGGQIKLAMFPNPEGVNILGGGLYTESEASGPPVTSIPGENGTGQIQAGFLESSNVDPVTELVTLIKTQRSFELNSQSIQTADQALQVIGNMKKS
ncbi:MAG TPA: flagellar basal-body rod protein FlgG [Tepidisphaeraceae bacterium]|jgi:flagellar basal-body rod protein FlgG|nr:flagellar basal-body rod protein FlgG [Tepidisphaeraceae bacterium]